MLKMRNNVEKNCFNYSMKYQKMQNLFWHAKSENVKPDRHAKPENATPFYGVAFSGFACQKNAIAFSGVAFYGRAVNINQL